jgi:manganese efflux pump family protein
LDIVTLLGLAIALAMDAFAVALGTALSLPVLTGRHLFRLSWHFGLFQALMPILGWIAGMSIQKWIVNFDHWIAFGLLGFIGGRMLWEAIHKEERVNRGDPTRGWSLVILSVATSIDALAVGLTLAMLDVSIWFPSLIIGLVAGVLTTVGMLLGRRLGGRYRAKVEIMGGLILIGIGVKILVEHLTS